MAMQWQKMSIPFAQGIDTKTDPKQLPPGRLLTLVNGELDGTTRIKKRRGYTARSATDTDSNAVDLTHIASAGGKTAGWSGTKAYHWLGSSWRNLGSDALMALDNLFSVPDHDNTGTIAGAVSINGYLGTVSTRDVLMVFHIESRALVYRNDLSLGVSSVIDVVRHSSGIRFVVADSAGNDIDVYDFNTSTLAVSSATVVSDIKTNGAFVTEEGDQSATFIAYSRASDARIVRYTTSITHSATFGAANDVPQGIAYDGTNTYVQWYDDSGTELIISGWTAATLSSQFNTSSGVTSFAEPVLVRKAAGCMAFYRVASDQSFRSIGVNAAGTATTVVTAMYGVQACGRPHYDSANDRTFVPVIDIDGTKIVALITENTTVSSVPRISAAADPIVLAYNALRAVGGGSTAGHHMAAMSHASGFTWPYKYIADASSGAAGNAVDLVDLSITRRPLAALLGDVAVVGESMLRVIEDTGLFTSPLIMRPTATAATSTSGALPNGTYSWKAIYRFSDTAGRTYRSQASDAVSLTLTGGDDEGQITVYCYPFAGSEVEIDLYRTLEGGSVFHYCATKNNASASVYSVTFTGSDSSSVDSSISGNRTLYEDAELPAQIPPPISALVEHKQRLWAANGSDLYFSKHDQIGIGVEWSDFLTIRVPIGDITDLASLDETLVVFSRHEIALVHGDGPNDQGAGQFPVSRKLVTGGVGCSDPRSVAVCPLGVVFKSVKGFRLLTRGFEIVDIGDPVTSYDGETVLSATAMVDRDEIRFVTSAGSVLVWDYSVNQWSTHDVSADATPIMGAMETDTFLLLRDDGVVLEEDGTVFTDASTSYALSLRTGWLKPDGIQGYFRIRRFAILAEKLSNHTLTVKTYYDYDESVVHTYTFNAATAISSGDDLYEFSARLSKQKCVAISFEIIESSQAGTEEGLSLSDLTIEVAVKGGINRLVLAKTIGGT